MINFSMSKQQQMVKKEVAKLVKDIVTENAHDMDEAGEIPAESIQKAWELGASISSVPEECGGYGMDDSPIESAIVLEALAYGDMAFAIAATAPSLFISPIAQMGTEGQKMKYLPNYCKDTFSPCSMAINEPRFGFDATDLATTAEKKGGAYVINGEKCFVPMAAKAEHMLVAASCDGKNELFIVGSDNPGLKVGDREKTLGLYALEMNRVTLENCEVPAEDRVGGDDGCNYDLMLQRSRVAMTAMAAGMTNASYDTAREYAKTREQFGEPIAHRQSVAFMLAEMAYEVDAIRLMAWKAASKIESGKDAAREAYLAKMYAGEMTMKIADYGVQVMGGHGYIREYPVERYYRNARAISNLEAIAIV
ncbi:MAG: acyl-CoA dehydrogenase family protein [Thermodesulfobacteriota bacterium]|nr:acyl-CoA dehydrogenase family protein [Thermodesulfobacteriota bacterium]